jgi:hypothetical protein
MNQTQTFMAQMYLVRSYSSPSLLIPSNDGTHELGFKPLTQKAAERGRCRSRPSVTLKGDVDGILKARIFISSTVAKSLGVFTIAIMETPFNQATELDLFVVNLLDRTRNKQVVKSGQPLKAGSIDLDKLEEKWITVEMTKKQNKCESVFKTDSGLELARFKNLDCKLGLNNTIVVNARSDNYSPNKLSDSMIKIASISWKQL